MLLLQLISFIEDKAFIELSPATHDSTHTHAKSEKQKDNLRYTPNRISFKRAKTCVYLW